MAKKVQDALKDIISLCKRRGFIFPGSEIYDGLANTWDYGPYGVELKRNIKNLWWKPPGRARSRQFYSFEPPRLEGLWPRGQLL